MNWSNLPAVGGLLVAGFSLIYVAGCIAVVWTRSRALSRPALAAPARRSMPSVSILKPLCGLEAGLEENLQSFCDQSYPIYEVLFGARDADDPALTLVRGVANRRVDGSDDAERVGSASGDVHIFAGGRVIGANRKVNTLANLETHARNEVIIAADSDVRVDPSYLTSVVTPLLDPAVGVVTCLFRSAPTPSIWSRLGALASDEWFTPSVLVGRALGGNAYCHGTSIALRREVLEAIGGFAGLATVLADDYELGARVRRLGLRCELAEYETTVTVDEPTFGALVQHELRWLRTIRTIEPLGYASTVLTYAIPWSIVAAALTSRYWWALLLPALAISLRLGLHWVVAATRRSSAQLPRPEIRFLDSAWLIPFRDLLSFGLWATAYLKRRVLWRGRVMRVEADGGLFGGGGEEVMSA